MVAVVLGPQVQQYLWLSVDRYGLEWLTHWDVVLLGGCLILTLIWPAYRNRREKRAAMDMDIVSEMVRPTQAGTIVMCLALMAMFTTMIVLARAWPIRASMAVYFVAAIGMLLAALTIAREVAILQRRRAGLTPPPAPLTPEERRRELEALAWVFGMIGAIALVGFHLAFALLPLAYTQVYGPSWRRGVPVALGGLAMLWFIFDYMHGVVWPKPLLLGFLY